jgi:hypothetical protein
MISTNFFRWTGMLIIMVSALSLTQAQMVLQLEKTGSVKRIRYFPGDTIEFKSTLFPDTWLKRVITEIRTDENLFVSGSDKYNLNSITHIRMANRATPIVAGAFYAIGVTSFLAAGGFWIAGYPPNTLSVIFSTVPFGIAWLIQKLFPYKTYRISNNRRLRALDLNFYPVEIKP